ncbi:MAG: NTP transferase domain-containing protein [Desulfovibrionaceae bacterium]|nr:NTP transferase domain-containing protein [Desulfovibrionaceae bacterium]
MREAVVLLAGGESRRMQVAASLPRTKAALPMADGRSALETLVRSYQSCGIDTLLVVSGFHAECVEEICARIGVAFVRNPNPSAGMFSSVMTGLLGLAVFGFEELAVFIQPVDCPLVRPLTIRALLQASETESAGEADCFVPTFGESLGGHPVLLMPSLVLALTREYADALSPVGGLRALLTTRVRRAVPVPDSFILHDMDRAEDYATIRESSAWQGALYPDEARELLRSMQVPAKGIAHGDAVGRVAQALAQALHERGNCVTPWLAYSGGLVHDIAKGQKDHEVQGGLLLENLALPLLARIVRDHRDLVLPAEAECTERELVYLADKYCYGAHFVPLATRFGQKRELFAHDKLACAAIDARLRNALALEGRLRCEVGCEPAAIASSVLAE